MRKKRSQPPTTTCKIKCKDHACEVLSEPLPPELVEIVAGYLVGFEGSVVRRISTQKQPSALCAAGKHKVALGFCNGAIIVWDSETNTRRTLLGHTAGVTCLTRLSDSSFISGSSDHTACVWDSCASQARFPLLSLCGEVASVARLSDTRVATGSEGGKIHVWCSLTGNKLNECAHEGPVWALAALSDELFASGSADRTVKVWNVTGDCVSTFHQPSIVFSLCALPNGVLAVGSWHKDICLLDVSTGRVLQTIETRGPITECIHLSGMLFAAQMSGAVVWGFNSDFKCCCYFGGYAVAALENNCLGLATTTGFHVLQ
jgi:WD40 repeat protein